MRKATAGGVVDVYCEEVAMFLLDKAGGSVGIQGYRSDGHRRTRSRYTETPKYIHPLILRNLVRVAIFQARLQ
jgi:hypothetical protein